MPLSSMIIRLRAATMVALLCFGVAAAGMANDGMADMSAHMVMTALRPEQGGDRQKAAALVESAIKAMAPYQDYRKALADGYEIFLPNIPQPQYHFTKYQFGLEARSHFDPLKPTSLIRDTTTWITRPYPG